MINKLREYFYRRFGTAFAKSGEDILLYQLLKNEKYKIYIDVGAHHPKIKSNSYYFYLRGWNGICIEPNQTFNSFWKKFRSKDTFLNIGISDKNTEMDYYMFSKSELNSFSKAYVQENGLVGEVIKIEKVEMKSLEFILDQYNIVSDSIGFLSIDAEGNDLNVLKSNNWKKYRPKYIIVESYHELDSDFKSDVTLYLGEVNYRLIGKTLLYLGKSNSIGNLIFTYND